jgi:hypothetical protein
LTAWYIRNNGAILFTLQRIPRLAFGTVGNSR